MFSLGGVEGDGYRVGDLTGCGTLPEHFVAVTGTGDKHVAIGDVLKDEGLADSAYLVIRAKRIACAELGCGW